MATGDLYTTSTGQVFDPNRVSKIDAWAFKPFRSAGGMPLSEALGAGKVKPDTRVLSTRVHADTTIVLLTHQLSYHHIAQGMCAGEPWMVSF